MTGKEIYLSETVKGTDKAAYRVADKVMTKLQAQVDQQRAPSTTVSFSYAIDEWLRTADIEPTTRHVYVGYIGRTIRPALGEMPVNKLSARNLETLYGELRRCRVRCDGMPFIEHKVEGEHDCKKAKCKLHECKAMAQSTVMRLGSGAGLVVCHPARAGWKG
ncbi:tyrosine-type recombinase/integrase [Prauserella flavalba]|uniref:hypothetical protein n=1 Tax=Prauserella flavalba TaxID=1477506 RepID=UPI0036E39219